MAFPVEMPNGYVSPASFTLYKAVSTTTSQYTALQAIQTNVLAVGYDLNKAVPILQSVDTKADTALLSLASQKLMISSLSTQSTNLSTQIAALDYKVAKMEPLVITESISFLLGAFISLAFVLSSKLRF